MFERFRERFQRADDEDSLEIGHLSSSLCHLGNIVARVGRSIRFDPRAEQVLGDEEAAGLLGREYRAGHWAVPGVS